MASSEEDWYQGVGVSKCGADEELWWCREAAEWRACRGLGRGWLVQWVVGSWGYRLLVTDATALWGQVCPSHQVLRLAQEWVPCIEAEVKELCQLVLSEITRDTTTFCWTEGRSCLEVGVCNRLSDLTYKWEFTLTRLSDDLFRHHWVVPQLVQTQQLGLRVQQLTSELEMKKRQLRDLLPDNQAKGLNKSHGGKEDGVEAATAAVVEGGAWPLLHHQPHHHHIMATINTHRAKVVQKEAGAAVGGNGQPTEIEVDAREKEEDETQRGAKVQKLTQAPPLSSTQSKKKKKPKLKI